MSARDLFADARALLAASTTATDTDARVLYIAKARATFAQLEQEVAMFGRELAAVEKEIARTLKAP